MRLTIYIVLVVSATTLFSARGISPSTKRLDAAGKGDAFATRRYFSKGGIGIVNQHLYIVVRSAVNDRNELIVDSVEGKEERWKGKNATKAEVVLVYEGTVLSSQDIPDRFDLSKAVVVSFENDKVRFFDFHTMSGGYYEKIRE